MSQLAPDDRVIYSRFQELGALAGGHEGRRRVRSIQSRLLFLQSK